MEPNSPMNESELEANSRQPRRSFVRESKRKQVMIDLTSDRLKNA